MKKLKIILLFSSIISLIYIIIALNNPKINSVYNINIKEITGKILSYKINGNQLQIKIKAKEKIIIFYQLKTKKEKIYFSNNLKIGDKYYFKGSFQEPNKNTNLNLFSYKNYLLSNKIYYIMNVDEIILKKENKNIIYKIKNNIYNKIKKKPYYNYLLAFILGDTKEIDDGLIKKFRDCGISHLIAISGMHINLFVSLLNFILKIIKKEKIKTIIIIIILWFYAFLIGFTPSVNRSVTTFTVISLLKLKNIKINPLITLTIVLFIFITDNPFLIYNTGFLFSYMISFIILLSKDVISKYKNYIIKTFIISLISFLASVPIIGTTFYEINILSPIINIIFIPLISYIVFPISLITFLFNITEPIYIIVINIIEKLINITSKYLLIKITIPHFNIYIIILYYVILILGIKYKKQFIILLIIIIIIYLNKKIFQYYHTITVIDVGQGDSILIELPNNKANILIDTGGKIIYETEEWKTRKINSITDYILIPYLKSVGINKIHYLMITHGDYDHMGEAINLVENFKVEKVIFNCGEFNDLEQELIKVLDKKKIPHYSCIKELNIDDNKLYFLNNGIYDNENDNSSVIYTELNNHKFLFMGDASVDVEKDLIEKYNLDDIDVLKVGHHGSRTSSSKSFIDIIEPKYSIISVGKNNRYGHPNKEVLENLKESKIYRTDEDGSIMFKIKNSKLKIETCSP